MDLVAFLRARLDEDEAAAKAAGADAWEQGTRHHETNVVRPRDDFDWVGVSGERLDVPALTGQTSNTDRALWEGRARHIARHDPAHVLADVEAKRRIVEQYDEAVRLYERLDKDDDDQKWEWLARSEALEGVLRLLALAAADHPDYDERWRPTT